MTESSCCDVGLLSYILPLTLLTFTCHSYTTFLTVIFCSKQHETVCVCVTRWEGQCVDIECDHVHVTRWANQGLEFLLIACEPRVLATLTNQQFAVRYVPAML